MIQWLGLYASIAKGMVSIPGEETKILKVVWHGQKKKKKKIQRRKKGKKEVTEGGIRTNDKAG